MEFLALVIAIVAFIFARKANLRSRELQAQLARLQTTLQSASATPRAHPADADAPPPAPSLVPEPAANETIIPSAPAEEPAASDKVDAGTPAAAAGPRIGLEERLGTRWVVWIGGLTLALGGLFLVKYSIEAGLLGPAVRVLLGGLFALALLVAGEFARRRDARAAVAPVAIANIPAILTAAGTAVAFATVYAAYALYGFLAPALAFVLLGAVALGDVLFDGDEVRDLALLVPNRRDRLVLDVERAVLAAIQELAAPDPGALMVSHICR